MSQTCEHHCVKIQTEKRLKLVFTNIKQRHISYVFFRDINNLTAVVYGKKVSC